MQRQGPSGDPFSSCNPRARRSNNLKLARRIVCLRLFMRARIRSVKPPAQTLSCKVKPVTLMHSLVYVGKKRAVPLIKSSRVMRPA